ncbi:MAG: hypothetical protein HZB66_00905 [Candidatus Aenigmarchaeota archaeon]|nr:hypothetical protein [Candidatus Aenigmarchaeota archaeon]
MSEQSKITTETVVEERGAVIYLRTAIHLPEPLNYPELGTYADFMVVHEFRGITPSGPVCFAKIDGLKNSCTDNSLDLYKDYASDGFQGHCNAVSRVKMLYYREHSGIPRSLLH